MTAEGEHTIVVVDGEGREVVVAPLHLLRRPDLGAIEHLARLQLAAHRRGWRIRVRGACPDLVALLELVGLAELVEEVDPSAR